MIRLYSDKSEKAVNPSSDSRFLFMKLLENADSQAKAILSHFPEGATLRGNIWVLRPAGVDVDHATSPDIYLEIFQKDKDPEIDLPFRARIENGGYTCGPNHGSVGLDSFIDLLAKLFPYLDRAELREKLPSSEFDWNNSEGILYFEID